MTERSLKNKKRFEARYARGQCYRCPNPRRPDAQNCQACSEALKVYHKEYWDKYNKTVKARYQDTKKETFEAYGGAYCNCCGETNLKFLTLDHINNDGATHRKIMKCIGGISVYRWAKRNNYPDVFQVLCMNCNFGKSINKGICPHKDPIDQAL